MAAEEIVSTAIAQAVEEYNDGNAFVSDIIVATLGFFVIGFDDCKAKVAEAYAGINLHRITPTNRIKEE